MTTTRVRLTATAPARRLLVVLGYPVALLFGWSSLQAVVAPGQPWWMRALAVAFAALFLGPALALPLTVRGRLRWLDAGPEGLRLIAGSGAEVARVEWGELAGVGVVADVTGARRRQRGNPTRLLDGLAAPWLELVPAADRPPGPHPGLGALVPAADGRPACWMVRLNSGWARLPDVGTAVRQWRPELWRGERDGVVPTSVDARPLAAASPRELRRRAELRARAAAARRGVPVPDRPAAARTAATPPPDGAPRPVPRPADTRPPTVLELPRRGRHRAALLVTIGAVLVALVAFLRPGLAGPASPAPTAIGVLGLVVALVAVTWVGHHGRPARLVATAGRLAYESGGTTRWSLSWSDVAGVRLERRRGRAVLAVRPTGAAAVDARPDLRRWWRPGRGEWRFGMGPDTPGIRELLVSRRPDLWSDRP